MSKLWVFWPDSVQERKYRKYRPKKNGKKPNDWVAPEHQKMVRDMERDFPRDDLGRRVEGRERELVIDPRPTLLVPPRQTYMGY